MIWICGLHWLYQREMGGFGACCLLGAAQGLRDGIRETLLWLLWPRGL